MSLGLDLLLGHVQPGRFENDVEPAPIPKNRDQYGCIQLVWAQVMEHRPTFFEQGLGVDRLQRPAAPFEDAQAGFEPAGSFAGDIPGPGEIGRCWQTRKMGSGPGPGWRARAGGALERTTPSSIPRWVRITTDSPRPSATRVGPGTAANRCRRRSGQTIADQVGLPPMAVNRSRVARFRRLRVQ